MAPIPRCAGAGLSIDGAKPAREAAFQIDAHPGMAGFGGRHLELVHAIIEPPFILGRIDGEPDALGSGQAAAQRHLEMAAVVGEKVVNPIH
jgi:hypothetical protein